MSSSDVTHADSELPPIDERLVTPETRYEMYDGELTYVAPADPPHGVRQAKIAALVEAHAAADFQVASEMLTRTSRVDDIAPDVSVFPAARDRRTGRRQLEQLAFEVVSTQRMSQAGRKASKLAGRGVRRVFAIDVGRSRALEWSHELETWSVLDVGSYIADPALAAPLPVAALVSAAKADDDMARALLIKRNPVLEQVREQDRAQAILKAVLVVLDARGLAVGNAERARILAERDPARIERWLVRAATCADVAELLAG
jgi:Uma2 family endonuclease